MSKSSRKARRAFDITDLERICRLDDFSQYGEKYDLGSRDRFFYFKNNGSNILAVAHLDSVQSDRSCDLVTTKYGSIVFSPVLDDRLGVYVVLELLPKLGITCDWLLTTDEEKCQSTAQEFSINKQYDWMFSFDRAGTDVVMYDYEDTTTREAVKAAGARVGMGSVSDISYLEDLKCKGFNWGVGYQDYHSQRAFAWLNDTFMMVARFLTFYRQNRSNHMAHEKKVHKYANWSYNGRSDYADYYRRPEWFQDDRDDETLEEMANLPSTCPSCKTPLDWGWCETCATDWFPSKRRFEDAIQTTFLGERQEEEAI